MFTRLYKPLIKLSFAISLLLIADTAALAQSSGATSGAITGVIKDSQGAVISNALISIEKEDTNLVFSTNSSNSGVYQATQLPPGTYKLSVTSTGFSTATTTLILTVGTTALVDIELEPGNTSDFITVNSETLATVRTESSTNITGEKLVVCQLTNEIT
ncbi:MAG: carboxypeptidase regulatory-like domain-containing protein [Blastocatellia bacterium]|nr:carboxypeptidase regulatory-like domain-containing protein [Blastocatellia bacterium]